MTNWKTVCSVCSDSIWPQIFCSTRQEEEKRPTCGEKGRFRRQIVPMYAMMLDSSILSIASVLLVRGEGVIRDTLSTEPTITCGQIIVVHSFFSECGGPARKEPVADWRSWSQWCHACTHSSADEGPQRGADAAVNHSNEWWNRLWVWAPKSGWGCAWRECVDHRSRSACQIVWQTGELREGASWAICGLHMTLLLVYQTAHPITPHRKHCGR